MTEKELPVLSSSGAENTLVFRRAFTEEEKLEIYRSRLEICQQGFQYILDYSSPYPAKDRFDDCSILFYVRADERIVASCRITPFVNNEWEISNNLPDDFNLNVDTDITVQLNRVYIDKDYRNQYLHEFMFYYFSDWVLQNTSYKEYFAICNAGLVRLYKRVGATPGQEEGFHLKKRGEHLYYFVKGSIAEFNSIVRSNYL